MANEVSRALNNFKIKSCEEKYNKLIKDIGPVKEDESCMKTFIYKVEQECGKECIKETMRSCGHECTPRFVIDSSKSIYESSKDLEDFFHKLNDINKGVTYEIEDGIIKVTYDECFCSFAKNSHEMPYSYCECSAGWLEEFFLKVIGKEVTVSIISTVIRGSDNCKFHITMNK